MNDFKFYATRLPFILPLLFFAATFYVIGCLVGMAARAAVNGFDNGPDLIEDWLDGI